MRAVNARTCFTVINTKQKKKFEAQKASLRNDSNQHVFFAKTKNDLQEFLVPMLWHGFSFTHYYEEATLTV